MYKLENFTNNGVAYPFDLIDNNLNKENLLNEYLNFQKQANIYLKRKITLKPNLLSKFFDRLCFNEEIINNVKKIIGPDLYIWSSAIFAKEKNSKKIVSFHQDNPYWQLSTDKVLTVWIALTESNELSGALKVFPGSSKLGLINKIDVPNADEAYKNGMKTTHEDDMLSYKHNLKEFLKNNNPVTINLDKKQYSIHHVNCVHGSLPNNSDHPRIGYAIRFISSDTQHLNRKSDTALHVCGKKNPYFIDEQRPSEDFSKEAIKNYEIAMNAAGAFGNKKY